MSLRIMLKQLGEDHEVHGRSWRHRGLWALALYRFGQWAMRMRPGPLRWAADKAYGAAGIFAPILAGVSIDRRTRLGRRFHIIHPGMVLIHPDVVFGDRCGVMHGTTFGTNSNGGSGVPKIGNDVFVGPGAAVLGGITIGDGACIAANSLVITDVPAGALAIGVPAKVVPASVWRTSQSRAPVKVTNAPAAALHG